MRNLGNVLFVLLICIDLLAQSDVIIVLEGPKKPVFVGEPFSLEVSLKRCGSLEKTPLVFVEPELRDLWLKKAYKPLYLQEGNCMISKRRFSVSAQQSGLLQIAPFEVKVAYDEGQRDAWGNLAVKRYWESHLSNVLELNILSLPAGVPLVGEFTVTLEMESREVTVNRALDAEIIIEGKGNFEDISIVMPKIDGVTIFTETPRLEEVDSKSEERWRQSLSFVGERDFTIPSIALAYFDPSDKRVKKGETEAVSIHVIGGSSELLPPKVKDEKRDSQDSLITLWYIFGVTATISVLILFWKNTFAGKQRRKKVVFSDHKGVLHLLLAHKDEEGIDKIIEQLEASVYEGKEMTIEQKELKKLLTKYQ